jgi:hypothetical protein
MRRQAGIDRILGLGFFFCDFLKVGVVVQIVFDAERKVRRAQFKVGLIGTGDIKPPVFAEAFEQ